MVAVENEMERAEVFLPVARGYRPASREQVDYATFLCEMEMGVMGAAATVDQLPSMSSYQVSRLISSLRRVRNDRLRRERRRGW